MLVFVYLRVEDYNSPIECSGWIPSLCLGEQDIHTGLHCCCLVPFHTTHVQVHTSCGRNIVGVKGGGSSRCGAAARQQLA